MFFIPNESVYGFIHENDATLLDDALAKNVVLTTGGYAANQRLFARFTDGCSLYSAGMPTSNGSGILIGAHAGGLVRNGDKFLPTFAGIAIKGNPRRVDFYRMPSLTPQERQPWEIFVNLRGERFVAEDHPSVDERENRLVEQPEMSFWIVFDEKIFKKAPPLLGAGGLGRRGRARAGRGRRVQSGMFGDPGSQAAEQRRCAGAAHRALRHPRPA